MRVLVIGGNGFIGSHLVDLLLKNGHEVIVLDLYERRFDPIPGAVRFIRGDLSQNYLLREALNGIDIVVHLAWSTIHEVSNRNPAQDILTNLVPTINLMQACMEANIHRILFASSGGTVYGKTDSLPIPENHPTNPLNSYGITKLAAEKYFQMFHHLHGLEFVVLRPSVPYGPRQNPEGSQGAVSIFLYRIAMGLPITIWGSGDISRDYFYISDLCHGIIAAAEVSVLEDRIFNLGGDMEVSLNTLIQKAELVVGKKAIVQRLPHRGFDANRIDLDTRLAKKTLDWAPAVSLEEGMKKTWDWIKSIY